MKQELKFNPVSLIWMVMCACIGYLFSETLFGTVVGLTVGVVATFIATVYAMYKFQKRNKYDF